MDTKICLAITIQIQRAQGDTPAYWLLEDSGGHDSSVPRDFPRESDAQRYQLHLPLELLPLRIPTSTRPCRPVYRLAMPGKSSVAREKFSMKETITSRHQADSVR
jgi:hypothetical protein